MTIFERRESNVRSYSRSYPVIFEKAKGDFLYDGNGRAFIDFLSGAGSVNYGHNNPAMKRKAIQYLRDDGLIHGLDLSTHAKRAFLEANPAFAAVDAVKNDRYVVLEYVEATPGPRNIRAVEKLVKGFWGK